MTLEAQLKVLAQTYKAIMTQYGQDYIINENINESSLDTSEIRQENYKQIWKTIKTLFTQLQS